MAGELYRACISKINLIRPMFAPDMPHDFGFESLPLFHLILLQRNSHNLALRTCVYLPQETAAATKIQSVVRKDQAMTVMESRGLTTSAIRNRRRRRRAAMKNRGFASSEDSPSIFACCGLGLAFGDATEEDDGAYRMFQKKQYEERQKQQSAHEAALRKRYMKKGYQKNQKVVEAVEVVDEHAK